MAIVGRGAAVALPANVPVRPVTRTIDIVRIANLDFLIDITTP